jgi:hypothetical protein
MARRPIESGLNSHKESNTVATASGGALGDATAVAVGTQLRSPAKADYLGQVTR